MLSDVDGNLDVPVSNVFSFLPIRALLRKRQNLIDDKSTVHVIVWCDKNPFSKYNSNYIMQHDINRTSE